MRVNLEPPQSGHGGVGSNDSQNLKPLRRADRARGVGTFLPLPRPCLLLHFAWYKVKLDPHDSTQKRAVHGFRRLLGPGQIHHHGNFDLAGRDHLDIDAFLRQRFEHLAGHARVALHAHAHDR